MMTFYHQLQCFISKFLLHFTRKQFNVYRCDELPETLSKKRIYLIGEFKKPWMIAFNCPCGCSGLIQLNTLKEAKPCWTYEEHWLSGISLSPSVWRKVGCKSHFFIKKGKVQWV